MLTLVSQIKKTLSALLLVGLFFPFLAEARVQMALPEREHVQTIVWIMEATSFVTMVALFLLVWRFVKRDQARRKSKQEQNNELVKR